MRRREFVAGLGVAAAWPMMARAQRPAMPTIGWLDVQPRGPTREFVDAFRRGMAEVGVLDGRDVTVEYRTADGHVASQGW
jgi:putative tryptophan/tyrosine transport system substrate-binding protein